MKPLKRPGPGQTGAQGSQSAGAVDLGGWIMPVYRRVPLVRVNDAGASNTSVSVAARIESPAARLLCSFSIGFEPDLPQDVSSFQNAVWSATAIRPVGPGGGREAQLHSLFSSRALPELYSVSDGVAGILVTATLKIPLTAAAAAIKGDWVLEAKFEPAMPMCASEVAALYARTAAKISKAATSPLAP